MAFFNFRRWLRSRPQVKAYRKNPRFVPWFEALEDRTLMSTLPAAVVNGGAPIGVVGPKATTLSGFSPDVVQDPTNPMNLVEFHANNVPVIINGQSQLTIAGSYSTNGGATWTGFLNTDRGTAPPADAFANIADPNLSTPGNSPPFAEVTNPTAAWDRGENIYVAEIERSVDNLSGAVVFQKFTFTGVGPVIAIKNTVLERWSKTDPILNPVVAVDNNLTSYTDSATGAIQTDSMATLVAGHAKAVYIAWNTDHTAPTGNFSIGGFNPNVIKVVGSSDGGVNFTSPEFVSNGGNASALGSHYATPQIVFTQGTAVGAGQRVTGGQLVFLWNDFGHNQAILDASQPDGGVGGTKVADSYTFNPSSAFGVASVNSFTGGINYVVGDVVALTGGTGTIAAEFTVTSVSAFTGAITGLSVFQGGVYTVPPVGSQPVINVSGSGLGSGATVNANFVQIKYVTQATVTANFAGSGYAVGDILYAGGGVVTQETPTPSQAAVQVTAVSVGATAAALVAGGGNYKVGDVLNVTGGTGTLVAAITVDSVSGAGASIATFHLSAPGSYTTPPGNPVSVTDTTTAAGAGAKFNLSFLTVVNAAINAGGLNYKVGDVLTVVGGNPPPAGGDTSTVLTVTAVNSVTGAVTAVAITTGGGYITQPPNPVHVTGSATGDGNATFTLAYGSRGAISAFNVINPGSYTVLPAPALANLVVAEVTAATVAPGDGGSGYAIGDVLTVQGGNPAGSAQLTVTGTGAGGAVTTVSISAVGQYTVIPPSVPDGVTDTTTPAATGALFKLTYSANGTAAKFDFTFASAAGTGPITDAVKNPAGSGPDLPGVSRFTVPVSIADPAFTVGDLEVTVDITHPHLNQLSLVLISPSGDKIQLLNNRVDGSGNTIGGSPGVADQANMGVVNVNGSFSSLIGTVFDQNAPRPINDGGATAPYTAHFRPEAGSLADFNGLTGGSANLTGNWILQVTDVLADSSAPTQRVDSWSLHFTAALGGFTTGFGSDQTLKVSPVAGAASASTPYAQANVGPYGPAGVGPDMSIAIDNTLGSFSPYQGRIYIAYTGGGGTNTDVFLASVDNLKAGGLIPNKAVKVNDDSVADGFSEGNRPQFMPTVAVDDVTGTVGVMYYDGRWDPSVYNSQSRAANSFSDSIDGGATFSPSTTLNTQQVAFNEITGATVDIGPIPGNQAAAGGQFGFGDHQGLVMNAGHVIPVFASNQNSAGTSIMTASVTIAAGPRIIAGDMGAITAASNFIGSGYNDTFAVDGTQQFSGFEIVFDRPIAVSTFTPSQVAIMYRDTVTSPSLPGVLIPSGAYTVTALDPGAGWGFVSSATLATRFLVKLTTPRSAVGTYSYAITGGTAIRDRLETATVAGTVGTTNAVGNFMDQNQDAVTGELSGNLSTATSLVIPNGAYTGGGPLAAQQYQLNDILTVNGGTFSSPTTIRVTAIATAFEVQFDGFPAGSITAAVILSGGTYTVGGTPGSPVTVKGGSGSGATFDVFYSGGGSLGDIFAMPTPVPAPGSVLSGGPFQLPYSPTTLPLIVTGPHLVGSSVDFNSKTGATSDNLVLNSTNNGLDVSFDRSIQAGTFTAANIERITGPIGQITPYTLGPTVTFTSINGVGSGAMGVATIVGGFVTAVNILNPGSGYTAPPIVVFNGGGGQFAAGTASIAGGLVTGVTVTNGGLGYTSMTLPAGLVIPAGGTLNATMTIGDSLQVNDLSVGLNITQAQLSELNITLVAPDGTKVLLLPGGTGANLTNAVFDDNAPAGIAAGVGPYTGVFRPVQHAVAANTTGGGIGYKLGDALTVVGGIFSTPTQLSVASVGAQLGALTPAAIAAGGTLYAVGDVLNVVGGTSSSVAQIQVTSVGAGGVITGASVVIEGSYTVLPASPVTVTGGAGSGATFRLAFTAVTGVTITQAGAYNGTPFNPVSVTDATTPNATGAVFALSYAGLSALNGKNYQGTWMLQITDNGTHGGTLNAWALNPISVTPNPQVLTSDAIVSGGTGYKVGDYITLQGGTVTAAAQLQVTSIGAGGVITQTALIQPGLYSVPPSGTVAVAGGNGTGATFTVAFTADAVANPQGVPNQSFRISLPTQTLSGTYSIQVGPDTAGNYLKDTSLNTATVVAGGSGYSVGTILTVTGGTGTSAQFMVSKVNAGAITAVELVDPGAYTVYPQAVAGGLPAAAIITGGSGYKPLDMLTVVGGVFTTAATLQVTSIGAGGIVTGATVVSGGSYTTNPTNPVKVTDTTTPAATGATFNLPVAVTSGSGSGARLALTIGNEIDTNLNAGIDVLRSVNPVAVNNGTLLPNLYQSGTINTPIPAGQTIDSIINVPDSFQIEGVTLQLSIQHQNDPDLTATLISPKGVSVVLFSGVGASGSSPHANFTNTTFDDTATIPIQDAATVPITGIGAGPFNPQLPLSAFTGGNSQGKWILRTTSISSTLNGSLVNWNLTLKNSVPGSGLGEPIADQFNASFRLFTQDPTNLVANQSWTAVGPASINGGGGSGRIGGLAIDPSDPSGNTVYVAGASGSVWKTTNFLTTDAIGPTYVPLTDLGPGDSLNTGGITVFPRNSDPNQSILFVVTGEGDTGTPGVGFLRSMDGGKTWRLLDSTVNVVTAANKKPGEVIGSILPIGDARRDHKFDGQTAFKVIVDPVAEADGNVIVYAALSGASGGIWRSNDTGGTWTLMQAGPATDVVLSAGSASSFDSNGNSTGNLQILYGAIEGQGVYYTTTAPTAASMTIRNGGQGVPTRRNIDPNPDQAIPVNNDFLNPGGNAGQRIELAAPAFVPGQPLQNTLYEGWLYAQVSTGALYETKDFGLNWTLIHLPVVSNGKVPPDQTSTNNNLKSDYVVMGSAKFPQNNYNMSLNVDPTNPNIVYVGGTADANPNLDKGYGGFIRVDATAVQDVYDEVAYYNNNNDGGLIQTATTGGVSVTGSKYGIKTSRPGSAYLDMLRDPQNPFTTPASLQFTGVTAFNNTGLGATYLPFTGGGLGGTDQHRLLTFVDPLTGQTRLIFGDDQGVWTGIDNGAGVATGNLGGSVSILGSRNGNLQITQFYDGAAQPSTIAADIAGALFYGVAQDDGFPQSSSSVLDDGNIGWNGPEGDGSGVKVDQTGVGNGGGTVYTYAWPCCGAGPLPSDFFFVDTPGVVNASRINGLLQPGDDPYAGAGNWGFTGGSLFAVNPIDPSAIVMSSRLGNVFLTSGPSLGYGKQWFPIAGQGDLDNTYAPAMAFGAPVNAVAPLDNFIYAGTEGGHIFVTFTGGGAGTPWTPLSTGLDGSPVHFIVTNPLRGSHEAYAVTSGGVFWMADSSVAGAKWVNITGNLFSANLSRTMFNDPAQVLATLKSLTALQADWRYGIPDNLANPAGPKHPVLYVGAVGGVYRSLDKGKTWTYFPDETIDGALQEGGLFPSMAGGGTYGQGVTNLALSLGNINPLNGTPSQPYGRDMLVATTYGRGTFAIRLDDQITVPGGNALYTYAISAVAGPHVSSTTLLTAGGVDGMEVTFSGPVDPATFTTAKVNFITDPLGNLIPVASIFDTGATNHNIYDIFFTSTYTAYGFYTLSLGPNISDYSGNKMDQNQNNINGENPADIYNARFLYQPFTNNAPVLTATSTTILPVFEDVTQAGVTPTSINSLVLGLGWPASGLTDADNATYQANTPATFAPVGIAVTSVDNTNGLWEYSLDNGTTWNSFGAAGGVDNLSSAARLLEANSNQIPSQDLIEFLPNAGFSSTAANKPSFSFKAWDLTSGLSVYGQAGGTADTTGANSGGMTAFSTGSATATTTVLFVNDQPSFTATAPPQTVEDSGLNTVSGWASGFNPGGAPPNGDANEVGQTVLQYIVGGISNAGLFAVAPAVDKTTGNLTYTLNPDTYGTSTFSVQAQDSGGTPVLAAAVATPGSGYKVGDVLTVAGGTGTAAQLQVTSISGAGPTGPVTGVAILQDGAYNLQPPNTPPTGSVTDVAPGTGSGATFTFTFATQAVTATLTPGGGGSGYALGDLLQVQGGTPVGPAAQATVTAVGAVVGALTPAEIGAGSTGYSVGNVLTVVGGTFSSPVTIRVTSVTAGAITGATVTAAGSYTALPTDPVSVTGGAGANATFNLASLFNVITAVQLTQGGTYNVQPSSPVSVTDLTTPAASGATLALTFGYVDLSVVQNFTISALFVNDKPTFTATNQGANENSGAHSVANWATFKPGGTNANELAQSVFSPNGYTVNVTSGVALFTAAGQPKVSNAGTLTYTLLPNVSGTSTFNVTVQDNGGMQVVTATGGGGSGYRAGDVLTLQGGTFTTAAQLQVTSVDASGGITGFVIAQQNGDYTVQPTDPVGVTDVTTPAGSGATFTLGFDGVDTSAAQTFTLNVNLINDQPSFTANNPPTVNEDSGAHTVSPWVISFTPGGSGEESGQTALAYNVAAPSNPGLFAVAPAVDASGKLTYTLNPNVSGTSTFAVTATDNGGTQVTAAAIVAGSAGTGYQVGDPLTVAGGTLVPATGTAAQLIVTSIGAGGAITGVTLYNDGAYTDAGLPPTPNTVTGGHGTGAKFALTFGGVDTSVAKTFTLTVTFVNDQPSFAATNPPAANVSTGAHTVAGWATFEPDGNAVPAANEAGQLVKAYTVSAVSNPSLFTATGKPAVDTSGNLTYTLAAGQSGSSTFTVVVQDNGGVANNGVDTSAGQTFTLTVQIPVFTFNPTTLPNATAAVAYSQTIVASGGTAPYTYTISSGALPAGLSLSSSGTLSGTPTAAGGFSFNVRATDATSISGVQGYTLTVNPPAIVFTPASLPGGQAGVAYSQALTAGGGNAPYSNFAISGGALPAGLALTGTGTISGTPAAVGTFSFTVTAQDSTTGTGAPYTGSQNFSMTVAAPSITITPATLTAAQAGAAYSQTLSGSGGTAPYSNFTLGAGVLPAGLALSSSGDITGTPTAVGNFNFTVTAQDSTTGPAAPYTGSRNYTLTVAAPTISFTPATPLNTIAGVMYSQTLTGQGGTAPYSNFTLTAGSLPSGFTLSSSGTISGTTSSSGTFNFTVRAQDSTTGAGAPYTGSQNYSLTVSAPFDPATLSAAMAGAAYSQAITAVAGSGPATNFALSSGALPNGITLTSGGLLSGTATVVGTFTFTVSASDTSPSSGPFTAMQQYTLNVSAPAISFTPATLTAAITGIPYSQTLTGAGGTAPYSNFTLTAGVLPTGLTLSSGGVIAGTTTALGNYSFTVQAQDSTTGPAAPYKGSQNYTLTVSVPFAPANLPAATAGANYSLAINAIAGTGPASNFSVSGALPGGVTLSAGGVLSGTPTAVGSFTFTVSASDSSPASGSFTATQQFTLTVSPPNIVIAPATLSAATAGVAYNQVLTASGGTAPYSQFSLSSGVLPGGLTLSSSGTLAGTPTAVGTFNFTVQAQDSTTGPAAPYTGSTSYSLVVGAPVITFSPASLTAATAGAVYSQPLSGAGGTAPYSNFKVTSGVLPAGLTLSSAGVLGGTASAVGSFNFTVTAQDSTTGPAAPYTGTQNYSLIVNPPVIVLAPNSLSAATVGVTYNQTLTPTGGTAPYSNFKLISGSLPAGLALNASTGVLSGTPTAGGSFSFTVQVQDSTTGAGAPYTGTKSYTLTVSAATITLSTLPAAQVGAAYNQTIVPSGGTAPYTLQLTAGTLPTGLAFNASTGVVSGKPTAGGTFNFTVSATDSSTGTGPYTGSRAYTVTVAPPTLVFSPSTLPGAAVGAAYSQTLTVSGGTAPYHGFSLSGGALPAGLTLSANGTIAGTPTAGGTFNFTVQATDSSTGTGPYTLGQNFSLTVAPPNLVVSPATLPAGLVAVPYSVQLTVSGGTAPYKNFVVTTGALPTGLTLSATGLLSGLPTGGGTFSFTVGVTDSSTGSGPYTTGKAYALSITPPNFSYDVATKTLTITGSNFQYSQFTTANAGGTHTNYNFTMDGFSETLPDTTVSSVIVNGTGASASAILITNDTYTATDGSTQETPERVSLGSRNNAGAGTLTRFTNNDASEASFTLLTLHNFPISYAYVGRNDSTVNLYGTVGEPYNGFVTAGNYSYMGGAGMFHLVQGASSVYGYSAGQPADFAYHYAANPGSAFVVSGTAYSYMSTMDTVKGVTQSYFNVGVGFLQNTGVSKNSGADIAYFFDSPGGDTFVGGTTVSYMYIAAPPSPYAEFDAAYGFAMVNAQSFVGGIDFAYIYDTTHNNTAGFNVIFPGQIGRIVD